jgi:hypothetical protein
MTTYLIANKSDPISFEMLNLTNTCGRSGEVASSPDSGNIVTISSYADQRLDAVSEAFLHKLRPDRHQILRPDKVEEVQATLCKYVVIHDIIQWKGPQIRQPGQARCISIPRIGLSLFVSTSFFDFHEIEIRQRADTTTCIPWEDIAQVLIPQDG